MLNLVCWQSFKNNYAVGATYIYIVETLHECQAECIKDATCRGINWEPSNIGKQCKLVTFVSELGNQSDPLIFYMHLDRHCRGKSYSSAYNFL